MRAAREHLVPTLSDDVAAETEDGVYVIPSPTQKAGEIVLNGESVPVIRLHCHSLRTHRPDTILRCNSIVKTVVGKGSGDQVEIIECGRCRTSYLVRTKYGENGKPTISAAVWNTSRNVNNYCKKLTGKKGEYLVKFNREEML